MGKAREYGRNIHRNMNTELFGKVSSLMRAYRASSHAAVRLKVSSVRLATAGGAIGRCE